MSSPSAVIAAGQAEGRQSRVAEGGLGRPVVVAHRHQAAESASHHPTDRPAEHAAHLALGDAALHALGHAQVSPGNHNLVNGLGHLARADGPHMGDGFAHSFKHT